MKTIKNYSKYQIYPDGRVYTTRLRQGWRAPSKDKSGYLRYTMVGDDGRRKGMYAHQLVALAYLPNPQNKPYVNHKDHNKANNKLENLEWCTHLENIRHDWKMGTRKPASGEALNRHKVTVSIAKKIRQLKKSGVLQNQIARQFGISQATVSQVVRNITWRNI